MGKTKWKSTPCIAVTARHHLQSRRSLTPAGLGQSPVNLPRYLPLEQCAAYLAKPKLRYPLGAQPCHPPAAESLLLAPGQTATSATHSQSQRMTITPRLSTQSLQSTATAKSVATQIVLSPLI